MQSISHALPPIRCLGAALSLAFAVAACSTGSASPTANATTSPAGATSSASATSSATPTAASGTTVSVVLTNAGCPPVPNHVPAGPVTFQVRNEGADAVTEVELVKGGQILAEKENLAPGLSGTFSVELEAGVYEIECPGATTPTVPFTVDARAP